MKVKEFKSFDEYENYVEKVCGDCSHFNACMQGNQTIAPTLILTCLTKSDSYIYSSTENSRN